MTTSESTCWTVIRGAAAGDADDRAAFARRYDGVVRAYLAVRWRGSPNLQELDDTVQEVFVTCFRPGGILDRAAGDAIGSFRGYLYGVVRNVARRAEQRRARGPGSLEALEGTEGEPEADEPSLSRVFDRAWAEGIMREAARLQAERAKGQGPEAERRVELLRLRFQEGMPVRDIAALWGDDRGRLHHEYARARKEFLAALRETVAFHQPGSPEGLERACAELLALLR